MCRAGEQTGAEEGGQRNKANPEFLKETEPEQEAFLVEVKCGIVPEDM